MGYKRIDFSGFERTREAIDPKLASRINERLKEIAFDVCPHKNLAPLVAKFHIGGDVAIGFIDPTLGTTQNQPTYSPETAAVVGYIIGAGRAVHRKSLTRRPEIEAGSVASFGCINDLVFCLNAIATDQSQQIDLPEKAASRG